MKHFWWKILGILLVCISIPAGLLVDVPDLPLIEQTIRNIFFHVPMWFAMFFLFFISFFYSIYNLFKPNNKHLIIASEAIEVGLMFGFLGILTGMLWAKFTWGSWWLKDPKLNGTLVSVMIYMIYPILVSSFENNKLQSLIASAYNAAAFITMIFLVMIFPRINGSSIHPGQGGNPALISGDIDLTMHYIFLMASIGWCLTALWILNIKIRLKKISTNIL